MKHYLHSFFSPSSIALFGASERESSIGKTVSLNLTSGEFKGPIYFINPRHAEVLGRRCFNSISEIYKPVELAIIAAPASITNQLMEECGKSGVKAAIILSAGFGEANEEGKKLEDAVQQTAKRYKIRLIGPNCLGVARPVTGLNATFHSGEINQGSLALVSQSGALCTSILDWAKSRKLGFSAVVSIGCAADVQFGELLDYLTYDSRTKSILLYIEGINHARSFISELKRASRVKPVLVLKVGRHNKGTMAAQMHTGVTSGEDDVFNAVLRQAGAVRGYRVFDLFVGATVLSTNKRLEGENLAIITNGGGPGAIAADRATDLNLNLISLSEDTEKQLNQVLPANWSKDNPIDIIGDATPERYQQVLSLCLKDKTMHGIVIILSPQSMTQPLQVAKEIVEASKKSSKVIICCFMGGEMVAEGRTYLEDNQVPTFTTPEAAIEAFSYLRNFTRNQRLLLQAPDPLQKEEKVNTEAAKSVIEHALSEGRTVLTDLESMAVLDSYNISTTHASLAHDINEAIQIAKTIGYPVVMKVYSKTISHKSDVGGVRLGISNDEAVKNAYHDIIDSVSKYFPEAEISGVTVEAMYIKKRSREVLVGISNDTVFGPIITFAAGGIATEIMGDREVAIPPLNKTLARELMNNTRIAKMLGAFRQLPGCNMGAIEHVLLRLSEMACELPWIKELQINPLVVDEYDAIALDAKIFIEAHSQTGRYDHMAIHPYPMELAKTEELSSGVLLEIRPIRPEDANLERQFVSTLSPTAKYFRFMQSIKELPQSMLVRFTQIDYDLEMALLAVISSGKMEREIGVARYITNIDKVSCEFAVVVADDWHRKGIAVRLMNALIESAKAKGLERMEGMVLAENTGMLGFCESLGFEIKRDPEDRSIFNVVKYLQQ
ncbi:bifunctional acetate--CoA ligase family protein/GNAT family N-acetyltransferase [Aliiglaciecola sp. 2_MG-2023]|uniref:bifunctional acetate--CoA ligase family protein/GNAT family N-acetyltransferase n=1 Tax=Alteromonadaceae TaxID=72275 RepID=UPI0026E3ED25|nr:MULTISPECIES: bifunctional acetate--CoA ligase family protein/GNAT family N-acetyltransferase [unclassified Aliiglaciecola]MDO6709766.1 bifunctional acetate--CoA ligase family protein/GNAT family N-acetyltransferase [Aliiglaciecola sp. 2_MG-2023]MDO6750692.1 bifunctional acetate--CoA ligase family protein/GNAT family N-acetyltransferase [Aliiglaciecola sp. 1_MG-2023]